VPVQPSAYFIFKITEHISVKFGIGHVHKKLSGAFNSGSCHSSITLTLQFIKSK